MSRSLFASLTLVCFTDPHNPAADIKEATAQKTPVPQIDRRDAPHPHGTQNLLAIPRVG